MISSGVDVTGPNTGCRLPRRTAAGTAPHHTLPRARTAARRLTSAARAMWNPIALAQANAVVARGVSVRWRDFKVGRVDPRSRARPSHPRDSSPSTDPSLTPPRVHLSQATARDVFAPVYIVLLLVILKLLVGEESLPVPELPVRSDCAPVDAGVSPRAVCWHYPTRTPLEKTLAYAPANHPAVGRGHARRPRPRRGHLPASQIHRPRHPPGVRRRRRTPPRATAGTPPTLRRRPLPAPPRRRKRRRRAASRRALLRARERSYVPLPRRDRRREGCACRRCSTRRPARTTPARAADDFPHFARR